MSLALWRHKWLISMTHALIWARYILNSTSGPTMRSAKFKFCWFSLDRFSISRIIIFMSHKIWFIEIFFLIFTWFQIDSSSFERFLNLILTFFGAIEKLILEMTFFYFFVSSPELLESFKLKRSSMDARTITYLDRR